MHYGTGITSERTLRNADLLDSFADELEFLASKNGDAAKWAALIEEARAYDPETVEESRDAGETVLELMDALSEYAQPYCYFGASEGDGACFGFFLSEEALQYDFDGLRVADTSEIPEDYEGEALHTNDHGNVTLYACHGDGTREEVWSFV